MREKKGNLSLVALVALRYGVWSVDITEVETCVLAGIGCVVPGTRLHFVAENVCAHCGHECIFVNVQHSLALLLLQLSRLPILPGFLWLPGRACKEPDYATLKCASFSLLCTFWLNLFALWPVIEGVIFDI